MSYLVLARKLRPTRFDDLIGQETAAKTLRNAVLTNRVAHAFLFTGSRGVGKTSAARILTKALNCLKPDNGDPCNICENCVEITRDAAADVYEIDAASNRGIENIRELRENVNYVPARCNYKIYIIDEAHMLTTESFNALLKTLEEPPPHVKFIFATTDPHKIPQTIISRCQRYDFLRISVQVMVNFLEKVVQTEGIQLSRKSLEMVARKSVGGMRDALTSVDQILSFTGTSASEKEVAQILGILDSESRFAFIEALLKKDAAASLGFFHQLQEHGHDVHDILSDLLSTIKTIALVRTLGTEPALFQDISADDLQVFSQLGQSVSGNELQQIFNILLALEEQMKRSAHSRICFEMGILQISSVESLVGIPDMIRAVRNLSKNAPLTTTQSGSGNNPSLKNPTENSFSSNVEKTNVPATAGSIKDMLQSGHKRSSDQEDTVLVPAANTLQQKRDTDSKDQATYTQDAEPEANIVAETQTFEAQHVLANTEIPAPIVAISEQPLSETKNLEENSGITSVLEARTNEEKFLNSVTKSNSEESLLQEPAVQTTSIPETEIEATLAAIEVIDHEMFTKDTSLKDQPANIPSSKWIEFTEEVAKHSFKLGTMVRNALPVALHENQFRLVFKSKHYVTMLSAENLSKLESIISNWFGHQVQVVCEELEIESPKLTVLEHEHILLEKEKEQKRENARNYLQVLDICSVFKNSNITNIKLALA